MAQSTDATVMQQYLHNNVNNITPHAGGQLPVFNTTGAYPMLANPSNGSQQRKGGVNAKNKQIISADYSMNVA